MKTTVMIEKHMVEVGIDKLVIGIPFPTISKADAKQVTQEQLGQVHAQQKEFVANLKHVENMILLGPHYCGKTKNKDIKRYRVLSEIDGKLLCIFSLGFSFGSGVLNLELNPKRLNPDKIAELLGMLSVMFNDHYDEVYERGVVSHAEFYVDVVGVELANLVLIDEGRRSTTIHKGTTYHGRRYSRLVGTMYDKAKELGEDGKLVRIEARINRRDIRFKDLVEGDLFNPLNKFLVVEKNEVQLVAQQWNTPQLANHIIELGLYDAIFNKQARKAILTQLKEKAVSWWQPDLFWTAHRALLLKFKPGNVGNLA